MNENAVKSLIEAFRELPLMNEVLNILEKKEFTDPGEPISDGVKVIGIMSPLERAIYTVLSKSDDQIKALGTCPYGKLDSGCLSSFTFEMGICPFVEELTKIKGQSTDQKPIRDLMFTLIKNRVDAYAREFENISLKHNFQITTRSDADQKPIENFLGFEQMTLEELMEVSIRGTFLEQIAEVLESGQFTDVADPIIEGDIVIREMTLLEKAMFTLVNNTLKSLQPLEVEHNNLLEGEAFEVHSGLEITSESFMGGMAGIISISMQGLGKKSFRPKDKTHPDFLRVEELEKEIRVKQEEINPVRNIMWAIINMGIDPSQKNGYDTTGIRSGFQIVVFNENE